MGLLSSEQNVSSYSAPEVTQFKECFPRTAEGGSQNVHTCQSHFSAP